MLAILQHHEQCETQADGFQPDLEMHGWQSTHTVVAILHRNTPFIVDSVRMALNRLELKICSIQHSVLYIERDGKGQLTRLRIARKITRENWVNSIFIEIDRHNDEDLCPRSSGTEYGTDEVRVASDYDHDEKIAQAITEEFNREIQGRKKADVKEARDFFKMACGRPLHLLV